MPTKTALPYIAGTAYDGLSPNGVRTGIESLIHKRGRRVSGHEAREVAAASRPIGRGAHGDAAVRRFAWTVYASGHVLATVKERGAATTYLIE